jgi:hypothetical protein
LVIKSGDKKDNKQGLNEESAHIKHHKSSRMFNKIKQGKKYSYEHQKKENIKQCGNLDDAFVGKKDIQQQQG